MGLIAAAGGTIDARIKVQKEAFLLGASQTGKFDHRDFIYHYYGPYSREISDALQFAVSAGLLSEDRQPGAGEGVRYSYTTTPEGERFLSEAGAPDAREIALVRIMHPHHWRALELAATVRFLELRRQVNNRNEALAEAIRLKPETKSYRSEAIDLLSKLQQLDRTQ
jgi:uncharacterized protein YwgA